MSARNILLRSIPYVITSAQPNFTYQSDETLLIQDDMQLVRLSDLPLLGDYNITDPVVFVSVENSGFTGLVVIQKVDFDNDFIDVLVSLSNISGTASFTLAVCDARA